MSDDGTYRPGRLSKYLEFDIHQIVEYMRCPRTLRFLEYGDTPMLTREEYMIKIMHAAIMHTLTGIRSCIIETFDASYMLQYIEDFIKRKRSITETFGSYIKSNGILISKMVADYYDRFKERMFRFGYIHRYRYHGTHGIFKIRIPVSYTHLTLPTN